MNENVTQEFQSELSEKWQKWLLKRFIRYCIFALSSIIVFGLFSLYFDLSGKRQTANREVIEPVAYLISYLPVAMVLCASILITWKRNLDWDHLIRAITWTIAITGFFGIIVAPFIEWYYSASADNTHFWSKIAPLDITMSVLSIHLLASLFIPWPPKEAVKAVIPLWVAGLIMIFIDQNKLHGYRLLWSLSVILAGFPGLFICAVRARRYSSNFYIRRLSGRYSDLKRELEAARQIQDMLFPSQVTEGPIQLRYHFEPMQQIGGDFIYLHNRHDHNGNTISLTATLIDVTGHGITAALAVNRLHGELERLYAEEPDAGPARVIRTLNKYINLTICHEGVFATAFSVKINTSENKAYFSNAGHPPAIHIDSQGNSTQLGTTCMMLGVLNDDAFSAEEKSITFNHDDKILAYTDGIIEARNSKGDFFKVAGLQQTLTKIVKSDNIDTTKFLDTIASDVHHFQAGNLDDDMLMMEHSVDF